MSPHRPEERAFRALFRLYPRRFRDQYGTDMLILFREQCSDEPRWRVCVRTTVDLAVSVPVQHLEARMSRTPNRLAPVLYLAITGAGVSSALIDGSNSASLIIGCAIALTAGAVGALAWRQSSPPGHTTVTASWWKFLAAGSGLIALVIVAAGAGVEAWYLGITTVLVGVVLFTIGLALGIMLVVRRLRPTPT